MCGIFGSTHISSLYKGHWFYKALNSIEHRGPNATGHWHNPQVGVAFGHKRLAIIDPSPDGQQPMHSPLNRYTITYNGEIYNFAEIKRDLQKQQIAFRGNSDTEVVLAAIENWGMEKAIERFVGMFAFALWDQEQSAIYLVRDRLGIKPLYYALGDSFFFASELKPFLHHPQFLRQIDYSALALFTLYNYIPTPYCIFKGVYKLAPGTILKVSVPHLHSTSKRYWSLSSCVVCGQKNPVTNKVEGVAALENMLKRAVKEHSISDVPLGAFLSGGIDSTTIVALMQAQSSRAIKTFTIGFTETSYNEAPYAKKIAQHLGTEHQELYLNTAEVQAVIPKLACFYDEPFADSSQIPTFLVAHLARHKEVVVCLSGDGGDELFAGYNRHFWGPKIWHILQKYPWKLRYLLAKTLAFIPHKAWRLLDSHKKLAEKIEKLTTILDVHAPEQMYLQLTTLWQQHPVKTPFKMAPIPWKSDWEVVENMMFLDSICYLPDDILTKVDRASMAVSLEARVPFLDHRLVEYAWRLPLSWKIKNGQGKAILREILYQYVPKEIMQRPKMGFAIPIGQWLKGDLRDWAEDLLQKKKLEDFFYIPPILQKWQQHLKGYKNWQEQLWSILMFQAWREKYNL